MRAFGVGLGLRQRLGAQAVDFRGPALPPGVSMTRGSAGTRIDAAGRIATEPVDGARFDHDPVTLAARGLLIEEQTTNRLLWSETIGAGSWSKNGSTTVTSDAAIAPDGSNTADLITQTAVETGPLQDMTVPAGSAVVQSMYLKAGSAGIVRVRDSADNHDMVVNLFSGTVVSTSVLTMHACVAVGGGWYRCITGYVAQSGSINCNPRTTTTGNFLVWGAQVELGTVASSYVPTTGAMATRSRDVVTIDWRSRGVPDGAAMVRYTFDDGTGQTVATTIAGGVATVPTTLARARVVRAAIV